MSYSSTVDFTLTRSQVITSALRLLGAVELGDEPSKPELDNGAQALNLMLKAWQNDDVGIGTKVER